MYDMNNEYNMYCFSLLTGRHIKCEGKDKGVCIKKGGSCFEAPFKEHFEELYV